MPGPIDRVDQLPLPSLQWYAGFSGLALFYVVVYAAAAPGGQGLAALGSDIWCIAVSQPVRCGGRHSVSRSVLIRSSVSAFVCIYPPSSLPPGVTEHGVLLPVSPLQFHKLIHLWQVTAG